MEKISWSANVSNSEVLSRVMEDLCIVNTITVAGPVCWNSLSDYLKSSDLCFNCFRQQLKTFLFCKY